MAKKKKAGAENKSKVVTRSNYAHLGST